MQGDGEFVHIRRALDRYFEVVATYELRREIALKLQAHVPHVEGTFQKSVTGVNESHFFKHAQVAICVVKARARVNPTIGRCACAGTHVIVRRQQGISRDNS